MNDHNFRPDDPETEAVLARLANDPIQAFIDARAKQAGVAEYPVNVVDANGEYHAVSIFATAESVYRQFDQMMMQWHLTHQLYPTSLFASTRCDDAQALVLLSPAGEELSRMALHPEVSSA